MNSNFSALGIENGESIPMSLVVYMLLGLQFWLYRHAAANFGLAGTCRVSISQNCMWSDFRSARHLTFHKHQACKVPTQPNLATVVLPTAYTL